MTRVSRTRPPKWWIPGNYFSSVLDDVSDTPMPDVSPSEQAALADLLAEEEVRTAGRIAALTRDFDAIVEGAEMSNLDDEHDPEGSTIGFERAQTTALLNQARAHQTGLEWARQRLEDGTYGRCARCGQAIGLERLRVRPTATSCVACAPARFRRR